MIFNLFIRKNEKKKLDLSDGEEFMISPDGSTLFMRCWDYRTDLIDLNTRSLITSYAPPGDGYFPYDMSKNGNASVLTCRQRPYESLIFDGGSTLLSTSNESICDPHSTASRRWAYMGDKIIVLTNESDEYLYDNFVVDIATGKRLYDFTIPLSYDGEDGVRGCSLPCWTGGDTFVASRSGDTENLGYTEQIIQYKLNPSADLTPLVEYDSCFNLSREYGAQDVFEVLYVDWQKSLSGVFGVTWIEPSEEEPQYRQRAYKAVNSFQIASRSTKISSIGLTGDRNPNDTQERYDVITHHAGSPSGDTCVFVVKYSLGNGEYSWKINKLNTSSGQLLKQIDITEEMNRSEVTYEEDKSSIRLVVSTSRVYSPGLDKEWII